MVFMLTYNSQLDESRPTGYGWMHAFEMYGNFNYAAGWAGVRRADGKWLEFTADEHGIWQNIDHSNQRLEWKEKEVTLVDGDTHYIFGATGQLARIENARGYGQTLTYAPGVKNKPGLLARVTDDFGASITFAYDDAGRLTKVTDPAGRTWRYGHDAKGNLTSVTRPDGSTRRYVYGNKRFPHHLTGIIDGEDRRYATYRYDAKGRGIESFHGAGREKTDDTVIRYTDSNKRIVNGRTFTLGFINYQWTITEVARGKDAADKQPWKGPGTCSGIVKRTYYPDGKLATVTDELGKLTTYTLYDRWGRPRGITENPRTDHQRTIRLAYHPALDRVTQVIASAPNGEKTTEMSFDDHGDPLEVSENGFTPEHRPVFRDVHYAWDDTGRMVMMDGPREDVKDITKLAYYPNTPGMGEKRGRLKSITDAAGRTATVTAYDAFGRVLERILADGTKERMKYDTMGRLVLRTLTDGKSKRSFHYAYDKSGLPTEITAPDGRTITYRYTSAEKPKTITDATGRIIRFDYDARGRITGRTIMENGRVIARSRTAYDVRNHPVETINALNETTHYRYDMTGRLAETDDAAGRITKLAYDPLNRINRITDPASHTTAFAYDIANNLTKVTAPNGVPTAYAYDDLGNRWKEDSKDRGVLDYRYDAAGLMVKQADALKQQAKTQYDALGRPVLIQYGKSDKIKFSYGKKGGASGRLTEIRENTGSLRYGYTTFGELASVQQTFKDGPKLTQSYAYDNAGHIGSATLPGGRKLTYDYDSAGRLAGVMLDNRPILTHMRYSVLGGITSARWGNGLKYRASYDALGRIVSQTQGKTTVAYQYDKAGNIVKRGNQAYEYDKLDRLIGAAKIKLPGNLEKGDIRYQYDANGNRTRLTLGTIKHDYSYQPGTNRLSKINDITLKYDAVGNLIKDGRFTYTYNARGRLASAADKQGHAIASYSYNALGLRTSKTFKGKSTYYVYNPNGMLAAEADSKGRILRQYVWLGIRPVALLEEGQIYYIHTNHLGTPRVVTDESKQVVWKSQPTPFGLGKPSGSITLNLRFPGQYYDTETGLNYNWHRYYNPKTGRYLTPDPLGLNANLNTYAYAESNPVAHVDPDGRVVPLIFVACAANPVCATAAGSLFGAAIGGALDYITQLIEKQGATQCIDYKQVAASASISAIPGGALLRYLSKSGVLARAIGRLLSSVAFHHTADKFIKSIARFGLRPGSYATPTKGLTALQAKIELALPGNLPRNAILEINLRGLRKAGYRIPDVSRVSAYKGLPGGGYEMQFPYAIPPQFIKVIQP